MIGEGFFYGKDITVVYWIPNVCLQLRFISLNINSGSSATKHQRIEAPNLLTVVFAP